MAGAPPAGPPKLTNLYHLRTVGTPKPCVICSKETVACLSNADVSDFLYTCSSHLTDPGFARPVPSTAPIVPQEEIDRVKKEFEEKLARKADKAKEAASTTSSKDSTWLSTGISAVSTFATSTTSLFAQPPLSPPAPATPPPTVFVLNRGIFGMRVEQQKKRWQAKEARERLGNLGLPSAPKGGLMKKVG